MKYDSLDRKSIFLMRIEFQEGSNDYEIMNMRLLFIISALIAQKHFQSYYKI